MIALVRLWRGEVPLGDAFWTWAVLGGLAVNLASMLVSLSLFMAGQTVAAVIAGHALSLPYNLLATVGVWRAAGRPEADPRWAGAARLAVVIGMTILSVT